MGVHNFAFPVLPGKEDAARTLQQTSAGSFVLVWFEATDVEKIFEILATRTGADADWMRRRIKDVGGVDMREPMPGPRPELLMEWPA